MSAVFSLHTEAKFNDMAEYLFKRFVYTFKSPATFLSIKTSA